jgi:proteasome accessory factor A
MKTVVPKIVGADVELSNFILGLSREKGTGDLASQLLLDAIDGIDSGMQGAAQPLDWGRKFLTSNGSCCYLDSQHLEIALPETFSAYDHVACWRAMLNLVRSARRRVSAQLPDGCRLQVLVNCSDGLGNSYGSHLNVLVTRRCWDEIVSAKPHYLAWLAAFQISSIVYTGQGKVGSECGARPADFQLSQRADFMKTLVSLDTMVNRGVINSRNEPHCGSQRAAEEPDLARLHVIFFDSTLCQVASLLRVGTMQMMAAMLEAGDVDARLALDDPLGRTGRWSRDVRLAAPRRS